MTSTFKRYDQMDADFFRRIILGEDVETNEDPVQADTTRPMGLMTPETGVREPSLERALGPRDPSQRMDPNLRSTSDNILTRAASALGAFSTDRQQVADAIVPRQEDPPQIDLSEWESLPPLEDTLDLKRSAAIDAQLQAMNRDAVGIRESLRPATPAATQEPADEQATEETATEETATEETATEETPAEATTPTYSTTVNNIFEEFKTLEGENNHLGSDYQNVGITLAYGIVPTSGLQYNHNGTIIDLPRSTGQRWSALSAAGVTRENFNPANVITDNAEKNGVNRSDYSSDEAWTRAVIQSFEDKVTERASALGVTLNDNAIQALTSYTWNTGSGTLSRPALTNTIRELGKDTPNYETIANGFFNRFTRVGGGVMQGLGRRRALEANELLEAVGSPWTIASYRMQRDPNNNEQFVFTTTQGKEIVVDTPTDRSLDPDSSFPTTNQAI